jgi:DNA-binding MarR family transcriptional regulator
VVRKPTPNRSGKLPSQIIEAGSGEAESAQFPTLESLTGFLLRCASNIADSAYYKQLGNAEITPRQLALLLSLRNDGEMTQSRLSEIIKLDRSTINEMVPRMIERNLISKCNSPDDKRAIHLSITSHGLQILKRILPATVLSQEMILAPLPKEYRRIFRHCLEMIVEANEVNLRE